MPDYSAGRIYKLVSDVSDEVYVGSTTQALSRRLVNHRADAKKKNWPTYAHFNEVGWDTVRIVLVEDFPCERREQLLARERYWMEVIGTLNKYRPTITKEEKLTYQREYQSRRRAANPEAIKASKQQYYVANRESCLARQQKYYKANREARLMYMREYDKRRRYVNAEDATA